MVVQINSCLVKKGGLKRVESGAGLYRGSSADFDQQVMVNLVTAGF